MLAKPAGPELAPNQSGEAELMPFPILDGCFYLFAGEKLLPDEVKAALAVMFPEVPVEQLHGYVDKFVRLFLQSIYKWVQSPLSLHIGNLDLERERALATAGCDESGVDQAAVTAPTPAPPQRCEQGGIEESRSFIQILNGNRLHDLWANSTWNLAICWCASRFRGFGVAIRSRFREAQSGASHQ